MNRSRLGKIGWYRILMLMSMLLAACTGGHRTPPPPTPVITAQPGDVSVVQGSDAIFGVTATGTLPTYQWQSSSDDGASWADIASATASGLTLTSVTMSDSGHLFRVLVTAAGATVASSPARLTVTTSVQAPAITVQPVDQAVVAPGPVTLSVTATGTSLQYQWQVSPDGGTTWVDYDGHTDPVLTMTLSASSSGLKFRVRVSNNVGSVTSNEVVVIVYVEGSVIGAPFFSEQPSNQSVTSGSSATFYASVSGVPEATLQWQRSNDSGVSWADIAGAISNSYTTPAAVDADNGAQFHLVATNSYGSATSNAATLAVTANAAPVFTTQPHGATVGPGVVVTLTVEASGTPTPTYQWQVSTDAGLNWSNMNGVTSTSYEAMPVNPNYDIPRQFRAVASNSAGTATSDPAKVEMQCSLASTFSSPNDGTNQLLYLKENHGVFCPTQYSSSVDPNTGIGTINFKDVTVISNGWTMQIQYRSDSQAGPQVSQITYLHPHQGYSYGFSVFSCADSDCGGVSIDLANHLITFNNATFQTSVTGDGGGVLVSFDGTLGFP